MLINDDAVVKPDSRDRRRIQYRPHARPSVGDNFLDSPVAPHATLPILHPRHSPYPLLEGHPSMMTSSYGLDSHYNVQVAGDEDCRRRYPNMSETEMAWEVLDQLVGWSHVPLSLYLPATPASCSETKSGPFWATYRVLFRELFEALC